MRPAVDRIGSSHSLASMPARIRCAAHLVISRRLPPTASICFGPWPPRVEFEIAHRAHRSQSTCQATPNELFTSRDEPHQPMPSITTGDGGEVHVYCRAAPRIRPHSSSATPALGILRSRFAAPLRTISPLPIRPGPPEHSQRARPGHCPRHRPRSWRDDRSHLGAKLGHDFYGAPAHDGYQFAVNLTHKVACGRVQNPAPVFRFRQRRAAAPESRQAVYTTPPAGDKYEGVPREIRWACRAKKTQPVSWRRPFFNGVHPYFLPLFCVTLLAQ